ncbi:TldD/PmbA family protein [Anabaena cylindrica FACHB-243]|uniref:Peptidase U62 modulator of DNA gyrase n=1 Tax=Anabaena cylindrica (strain ATCC 27899 / PCC 7122) TaxID=272123 RepID=K9ZGH7_ANACC|nr:MULTISPECIES: TldD/PmbA family protein [Anabaena]AFZ57854.1 peptidase U62 modulator of DNA gyrase [Anabaena cylindrica PCC 7122]MBD2418265.1 TldD/PmbA family protein [Anabaena cylindrica FACHB-243]MBY5281508.1 TldD/PmbA family protein [Anabaena sp. CCAP 1446/1C]MBY5307238.1 TldD/PmbA family protein [Anabaena sp. CCAP 1446/1C]MCM2405604.1 TldD/PmbA family protein [Anabaena sp. CCAP 1446/1C]
MASANLSQDTLAEHLLELALKSGAEAAEVYQSRSLSRPVFFEANRLKQLETSQSEGTALRLWLNGRPGLTVAYGSVDPQVMVERSLALSQLNQPELLELVGKSPTSYPDVGEAVPVEKLIKWGKEAIALIRDVYPDVLCHSDWECDVENTRLINSKGLDCHYTDTTLSCYISAEWVRGDDFLSVADGQTQRGELNPDKVAYQILQRLAWSEENNVTTPSGRVPVLFTSKAADMLWGTVQAALNGKRILEKSSPWGEKLGKSIVSPSLTLYQDPEAGPYSCPFDDEGQPTQSLIFIENGILQNFYSDRTTGRQLNIGSTGNGFRPGLGSYPTPGLFNFLIEPGTASLQQLIQDMDEGLIVDQILGGGDGISGDFSINIDLGYWVKKGQVIGRVKDTMVAGNVYTALKQLVKIGGDADWNGACYTPSLIVEGLSITGRNR